MRYLDCGCAIYPDSSRAWCPSCMATTATPVHNITELVETIEALKRENAELRAAIHRHADKIQAALARSEVAAEQVTYLAGRLSRLEAGAEVLARHAARRGV